MVEDIEEIYQALLKSGFTEEELNSEIEQRYHEYQGFMSKSAILFVIAKESGLLSQLHKSDSLSYENQEMEIDYNEFLVPIASILEGVSNIVIIGKITHTSPVHTFIRKDGTRDIVGSFRIADTSGQIKVVLWSDQAKFMEQEYFKIGQIIQVIGGFTKKRLNSELEVYVSKKGKVILSPKDIDMQLIPELEDMKIMNKHTSSYAIQDLYAQEGFIPLVSGKVAFDQLKVVKLKNGTDTFLLKCKLYDKTASIMVNIWGLNAPEFIKNISEGQQITLSNVMLKKNAYTNQKELNFTQKTRVKPSMEPFI